MRRCRIHISFEEERNTGNDVCESDYEEISSKTVMLSLSLVQFGRILSPVSSPSEMDQYNSILFLREDTR